MNNSKTTMSLIAGSILGLSLILPNIANAIPVTYKVGSGSASGFSGSWLHAATNEMRDSGFFANGSAIRMNGSLTIDRDNLQNTSGSITGSGDFGIGSSDWTLSINSASSGQSRFFWGERDVLSLDYQLTSSNGHTSQGNFFFADRDFNGGSSDNGPNYVNDNIMYLWGNNWLNERGADDRAYFIRENEGVALGLDLYGVSVPEPGILALLATGLIAVGFTRRRRS